MRRPRDTRYLRMLRKTIEFKRGDRVKICAGCYAGLPIDCFTTMKAGLGRRLIAWCRECVKIKPTLPPMDKVFVNHPSGCYFRKRKNLTSV